MKNRLFYFATCVALALSSVSCSSDDDGEEDIDIPVVGKIAVTGAIDLVSDGTRCYVIRNGRPEMGQITGTGCQLSGLMTAFVAANPSNQLDAAAAAVCAMGLAGEIGYSHMKDGDGNSTYRNRIIDAIYNMDGDSLEKGVKYEVR